MTAKTLLVLAALMMCTLAAHAGQPQASGGTVASLPKPSAAGKSPKASSDADWDTFVKHTDVNARRGYGSGMATLLGDAPSSSFFARDRWKSSIVVAATLFAVWLSVITVVKVAAWLFQ